MVKEGRSRSQPRESRMAKSVRITEEGSRAEGLRLAAEDGVSDDARRNEPWKSQGPLGEGGSEAEEMAGTQWSETISPHVLNEGGGQPT
jgi:hypothetical protein